MIVLRSILTYLTVSLYVLIVGPPLLAGRIPDREPEAAVPCGTPRRAARSLGLSGMRTEVEGVEHLQRQRAAVYAVNHTSNVEPPIIFDMLSPLFPGLKILYKAELRKLPVLVRAFDLAGFVPLERRKPRAEPAGDRARGPGARVTATPS